MIDGQTKIFGILGRPVAHSLSPAMHNAAFRHLGINAVYVAFPVKRTGWKACATKDGGQCPPYL